MADKEFFGHIIDNEEVESLDGRRFDVYNPWSREVWAEAAEGSAEDARRAVKSARKAFDEGPWPRMGRVERANMIHKLGDLMEERADELAGYDAKNMSKPFEQAKHDVARSVWNFRFFADHQRDHVGEVYPMDSGHHTYSEFGPAGVGQLIDAPVSFLCGADKALVFQKLEGGVDRAGARNVPAARAFFQRLDDLVAMLWTITQRIKQEKACVTSSRPVTSTAPAA